MFRLVMTIILIASFGISAGCSWVGRTAGKAQAKIERKVDAVEDGYNQGYSSEKKKTQ